MDLKASSNAADYTTIEGGRRRRAWTRAWRAVGAGIVVGAALLPLDGVVATWCRRFQPDGNLRLGGDLRREMEFVQQFGAITSILLTAAFVMLLDPGRRRALRLLAIAALANVGVINAIKMLVGRPRPKFLDPLAFTPPWDTYTLPIDGVAQPRHAWEVWRGISSNLWSMPSSHTAAAAVLAVFIATLYPKCRWLVFGLVGVVGVCRVLLGAHYPSDVILGGAIGYAVASLVMAHRSLQRPEPPAAAVAASVAVDREGRGL